MPENADKICAISSGYCTCGDPVSNFDKLVSHIHSHVIGLDHPLGMGTAVKLYLGSDTDEASGKTMKKRRQRLKKKLLDH